MKVTLLEHTPNLEKLIATAARLCYSKDTIEEIMNSFTLEKIDKFVSLLSDLGHESPFEHASFTFSAEGVSRSLTHQLVRHRIASYSQKSQRYVTEGSFTYVVPPKIEANRKAKARYVKAMKDDQEAYTEIFDELFADYYREEIKKIPVEQRDARTMARIASNCDKIAAEDARYVLPNACDTSIVVTMNVRSLYNFFSSRCCERAQWEIRELAMEMLKQSKEAFPKLFNNAGRPCIALGYCPENSMQCKKFKEAIPTHKEVKAMIKEMK
jgi:thymidylate synthase (FAD)